MTSEEWAWAFTPRAADQFDGLDGHVQDRIVSKLDEVAASEWREPADYLEPLTGGPLEMLRIGQNRLACTLDRTENAQEVHRIERRSGAYTADDKPTSRLVKVVAPRYRSWALSTTRVHASSNRGASGSDAGESANCTSFDNETVSSRFERASERLGYLRVDELHRDTMPF